MKYPSEPPSDDEHNTITISGDKAAVKENQAGPNLSSFGAFPQLESVNKLNTNEDITSEDGDIIITSNSGRRIIHDNTKYCDSITPEDIHVPSDAIMANTSIAAADIQLTPLSSPTGDVTLSKI